MQRSSRSFIRKSVVAVIALLSLFATAAQNAQAQFETASVLGTCTTRAMRSPAARSSSSTPPPV